MKKKIKKVLFFGAYDRAPDHRAVLLEKGLNKNNIKVVHCHGGTRQSKLSELLKLPLQYLKLTLSYFRIKQNYDAIFIPPKIGHFDVFLIKILKKIKKDDTPIIFDAFLSIYDTIIVDRGIFKKNSFLKRIFSKIFKLIDQKSCSLADIVILDTHSHARYFKKQFKIPKEKLRVIYEGVNDEIFKPMRIKGFPNFTVLFYASIQTLSWTEIYFGSCEKA